MCHNESTTLSLACSLVNIGWVSSIVRTGPGGRVTVQRDPSFRYPVGPSKANCLSSLVRDDQSHEFHRLICSRFIDSIACCFRVTASFESELLRSFQLAAACQRQPASALVDLCDSPPFSFIIRQR